MREDAMKPFRLTLIPALGLAITALVALLGGASILPPARAQAPQQTVAFLIWGLEEGPSIAAVSSTKWIVQEGDGSRSTFDIKQVGACRYDAQIQRQMANSTEVLQFDYAFDLSAVTEYDAWIANQLNPAIIVKIEGTGWYSKRVVNLMSGRKLQTIKDGSVDTAVVATGSLERLRRAYDDFRANHCPHRRTGTAPAPSSDWKTGRDRQGSS